ncbi:hypothetical protein D3C78_1579420 [compost metagenome]
MEGRLHQAALAQVVIALAGQEPLAHEELGAPERPALHEVLVLLDQRVADQIRVVEHVDPLGPDAEARHVAVLARDAQKEAQRIAPKAQQQAAGQAALRAGGDDEGGVGHGKSPGLRIPQRPSRLAWRLRGSM